jgi:phosphatidylserine decarboxylase
MQQHKPRRSGYLLLTVLLSVCLSLLSACAPEPGHEPVVLELGGILDQRPELRKTLEAAISRAELSEVRDLEGFYSYLDEALTTVPTERVLVPQLLVLYYIINQAPEDALNKDEQFNVWLHRVVDVYGEYLDTPASAAGIETFAAKTNYKIDDYFVGPSGWLTFNQFFAREVRPGKRPIAEPRDDKVIVSPADAVFMGSWPIDAESNITVKGVNWDITELLAGSPYADAFSNGIYSHSFLYVDDYHRYHVPVGGTVKEVRNISGKVYMDVVKNDDGELDVVDGHTYQFNQERGLVVIDSPELGLVAVLPIGMSWVSSVNLTPETGALLRKGEQFGYFLFGGSDIVMVFQDRNVVFEAEVGTKYLQGQRLGSIGQAP